MDDDRTIERTNDADAGFSRMHDLFGRVINFLIKFLIYVEKIDTVRSEIGNKSRMGSKFHCCVIPEIKTGFHDPW